MPFSAFLASAFAISIVSVLVIVGLLSAPWQLLLLFLVLVFSITERSLRFDRRQSRILTIDPPEVPPVEPSSSAQDAPEAEKTLLYRGAPYKIPSTAAAHDLQEIEVAGRYQD